MRVWRIAVESPAYAADDLSGSGAKITGGRWNRKGNAMLYASSSIALACLETLVHLDPNGLPLNRYLVELRIPEPVWDARRALNHASAPKDWNAVPAAMTSLEYGDQWLAAQSSAVMLVPAIVVPEEHNILINPLHDQARLIKAIKLRKWTYDPRLKPPPA